MRQAIAWQLCERQVIHQMSRQAAELLKAELAADDVCDLQVRLTLHTRSARLLFFPAWHLAYTHGEMYTPSRADIVPAHFQALIGGAAAPGGCPAVAAELHPSPVKSQAAAAAAVTGVSLGVLPAAVLSLGLDPSSLGLAGADAAFLAVLAASGAGVMASQLPLIARNRHAAKQAEADRTFYRQYDLREAGYGLPPDAHTLWLWRDADWRKWERDEPWDWAPERRRAWAERLFQEQAQRDVDRVLAAQQQERASKQQAADEEREAKREAKFGRSRRYAHGGHEEAGTRMHHASGGAAHAPRRRRDFLGYYKALGIDPEEAGGAISGDFIKSHYKAAALKLHPDKHVHADAATQRRSAEKFRRLQLAYETLQDTERRRAYDQGRLVQ